MANTASIVKIQGAAARPDSEPRRIFGAFSAFSYINSASSMILSFVTLALSLSMAMITVPACAESASPAKASEPVSPIPEGADEKAWNLLKSAHDARQVLPSDFEGFDALLNYSVNGKSYEGKLVFRNKAGGTNIDIAGVDKDEMSWLKDKLISMIGHRRGGEFSERDGRHKITFGGNDSDKNRQNRLGTLVFLNDKLNSSYRVKDRKVMEVTRMMGNIVFTISVIQTMTADPGKYLAHHFLVTYRDKKSSAIQQVDGFRDKYKKIDSIWLPVRRTVITITPEEKTPEIRQIELSQISVLRKKAE